jgi:hypothetical protein
LLKCECIKNATILLGLLVVCFDIRAQYRDLFPVSAGELDAFDGGIVDLYANILYPF